MERFTKARSKVITRPATKVAQHGIWATSILLRTLMPTPADAASGMRAINMSPTKAPVGSASATTSEVIVLTTRQRNALNLSNKLCCGHKGLGGSLRVRGGGAACTLACLRESVETNGAHSLPGCSVKFESFFPVLRRAQSRGYVKDYEAEWERLLEQRSCGGAGSA